MQYLIQGIFNKYNNNGTVTADTPLAAIKILLASNHLKGKIEKANGRGNCTVTSLGQRQVTTNYRVYDLVPNIPKTKAFCIITYDYEYDSENKVFKQYLYSGSMNLFLAECGIKYLVSNVKQERYFGRQIYTVNITNDTLCSVRLRILEVQGATPKQAYVLLGNCLTASVDEGQTHHGEAERIVNETFEAFSSEAKRKPVTTALIKNYKAQICRYLGKPKYKNGSNMIGIYRDSLANVSYNNVVDTGYMDNLDKNWNGQLGLYNVVHETLIARKANDIVDECLGEHSYRTEQEFRSHS